MKTEVVLEWRKKEYPAVELPKLFGDPHRRFSRGGSGYEAAVTASACSVCAAEALKTAPPPPVPKSDFSVEANAALKPSVSYDIPANLAFDRVGARFTVRLPANQYYPKGQTVRVLDRVSQPNRQSYLLIEEVRKKSEEPEFVEVSFKIVPKPLQEAVA